MKTKRIMISSLFAANLSPVKGRWSSQFVPAISLRRYSSMLLWVMISFLASCDCPIDEDVHFGKCKGMLEPGPAQLLPHWTAPRAVRLAQVVRCMLLRELSAESHASIRRPALSLRSRVDCQPPYRLLVSVVFGMSPFLVERLTLWSRSSARMLAVAM